MANLNHDWIWKGFDLFRPGIGGAGLDFFIRRKDPLAGPFAGRYLHSTRAIYFLFPADHVHPYKRYY